MNEAMRKKYLAAIHASKKELCLSDADYRVALEKVVGKDSAKDCNEAELVKLILHFKSFKRGHASNNYYHVPEGMPNSRQLRHLAGLWVKLGFKASGLDTRAQKQFGARDFLALSSADLQTLGKDLQKRLSHKAKNE